MQRRATQPRQAGLSAARRRSTARQRPGEPCLLQSIAGHPERFRPHRGGARTAAFSRLAGERCLRRAPLHAYPDPGVLHPPHRVPANKGFQPSPFSDTSEQDNQLSFAGARDVYFGTGLDQLVQVTDAALAVKIVTGFDQAEAALASMDGPYARFLAPASDSNERATGEAAARALTDLARDLRQAANQLGLLVVVPGM
ncbi:hypothetical protein JI748_09640 [Devosia rhizoryzae]|uniref:Imelysin-like domain-containing protein n=1 Tax=Devosia rhizoryzae TaxID=2774137 RepID=A0ABX7C1E4_9HYPH|nr:hypothetical protein JI748_09640 [Devosia rhizoryzae]